MRLVRAAAVFAAMIAAPVLAGETVSYEYDQLGRLKKVTRSGTVNNGVVADYGYDAADNRSQVSVSGSTFGSGARVIVVPLKGITLIPLGPVSGS